MDESNPFTQQNRSGFKHPELKRLESVRNLVAQLRAVLMDPELAGSVEVLNAARPQLESAVAELAALELPSLRNDASTQGALNQEAWALENDVNFRVSQQLRLLHGELHSVEGLRANASEFWKGWSKLLGVEADSAGSSYSPSGIGESIPATEALGNVSVRG